MRVRTSEGTFEAVPLGAAQTSGEAGPDAGPTRSYEPTPRARSGCGYRCIHTPAAAATRRPYISPAIGTPRGMSRYLRHCIILMTAHSGVICGPASTPMLIAASPARYSSGCRGPCRHCDAR